MYLTMQYKSMALMRAVKLHIFLPNDGLSGTVVPQPYKTLYFLNGFGSSAEEMLTYMPFRRQSEIKKLAIVMPDGDNSFYVDHPERLANYATFVNTELVEITRNLLPLSDKREDTFLGGISMGGYGALRNGLMKRDVFGKIAVMSPAIDPYRMMHEVPMAGFTQAQMDNYFGSEETFHSSDLNPEFLAKNAEDKAALPKLFLTVGRQDTLVYTQGRDFAEAMKAQGISLEYVEADGGHETDFWESVMDAYFSFLADIPAGSKNKILMR